MYKIPYYRKQRRNIINNKESLENTHFDIDTRINIRKYFDIYKPYSINDFDLIKYEKNGVKTGNLEKHRKFYFIAKGGGGSVSAVLVPIENADKQFWCSIKIVSIKPYLLDDKNIMDPNFKEWRELIILKKCSKLVLSKKTQNLPLSYGFRIYNETNSQKLFLYTELAYANLEHWIKSKHNDSEWKSFFFQFWYSLYSLQSKLKLVHNDLRLPNILYHKVNPGGYWKYIVEGVTYYVPNHGDVFLIWDFGSSEIPNNVNFNNERFYNDKLNGNTDLIYVHSMYQRIRVLALETIYNLDELKQFFNTPELKQVYQKEYDMNKKRFDKERFPKKFKMALIYYLVENDLFEIKKSDVFPMPPDSIDSMLKELYEKDNMTYKQVAMLYRKPPIVAKKLDSPQQLIKRYLSEFTQKQEYSETYSL